VLLRTLTQGMPRGDRLRRTAATLRSADADATFLGLSISGPLDRNCTKAMGL